MVTVVQGKVCAKNHPDRLSRLATIHQRYRQTDRRTDGRTDGFPVAMAWPNGRPKRITDERGNGRRPILAGTGKRWLSRSGWLLVVIRICAWIPVFRFLRHWGIGDFLTFVSTSLFSQFSCNQQPIWTKLGEMNDADECIHNFGTDIRRTSGSRLVGKVEFESGSLSFQSLASAEVYTLYYRQNIFN